MNKLVSINPADGSIIGEVNISSEKEIIEKVALAHATKKHWKSLGVNKRIEILRPLLNMFKAQADEIALLTTKEMGKTISESKEDLNFTFDYFQEFLDNGAKYIADEITFQDDQTTHKIVYEPRGVVACIVPWNFPFSNFLWGVIPNLIVGNTVVFKHSEECPLIGKLIENTMLKLKDLPIGVFSEVYGKGDVGAFLANQDVDMIWFTGSSATGKKLFDIAGKKQIKAILEMGGSNPTILFDDVAVDDLIPKIYNERFFNCGQVCTATKRLIVHRKIYNTVVVKLAEYIKQVKMGDPLDQSTQLGPLAAMRQLELLESQVNDSAKAGAKIYIGGTRKKDTSGAYFYPTILTEVNPQMRVWREEIFGPVLPIIPFDTTEEAIHLANDTIYGLGGNVYSANLNRAREVAHEIEAGSINVNEGNHWKPCNPFGGYKASGMGYEHGRHGFQELCRIKVIAEA